MSEMKNSLIWRKKRMRKRSRIMREKEMAYARRDMPFGENYWESRECVWDYPNSGNATEHYDGMWDMLKSDCDIEDIIRAHDKFPLVHPSHLIEIYFNRNASRDALVLTESLSTLRKRFYEWMPNNTKAPMISNVRALDLIISVEYSKEWEEMVDVIESVGVDLSATVYTDADPYEEYINHDCATSLLVNSYYHHDIIHKLQSLLWRGCPIPNEEETESALFYIHEAYLCRHERAHVYRIMDKIRRVICDAKAPILTWGARSRFLLAGTRAFPDARTSPFRLKHINNSACGRKHINNSACGRKHINNSACGRKHINNSACGRVGLEDERGGDGDCSNATKKLVAIVCAAAVRMNNVHCAQGMGAHVLRMLGSSTG
jgi:hypothetical protein